MTWFPFPKVSVTLQTLRTPFRWPAASLISPGRRGLGSIHRQIWKWEICDFFFFFLENLGFIKASLRAPEGGGAALSLALEDQSLLRPLLAALGSHPILDNN